MQKLKKGDKTHIKSIENGKPLYFTGVIDEITFNNAPCVFLATNLNNKNTYSRYSQTLLNAYGYYI